MLGPRAQPLEHRAQQRVGGAHGVEARRLLGGREVGHVLGEPLEQKRVALRLARERARHGRIEAAPGRALDEADRVGGAERREREQDGVPLHGPLQPARDLRANALRSEEPEHDHAPDVAREQLLEQGEALLVRPLEIVQEKAERRLALAARDELAKRVDRPLVQLAGIGARVHGHASCRPDVDLRRPREHAQGGKDPREHLERRQERRELGGGPLAKGERHRVDHAIERHVRDLLALVAAPTQREEAEEPRALQDPRRERALADAARAGHEG